MLKDTPFDPGLLALFKALTQALIHYTPEHFKSAYCIIEQAPGHVTGRLQYQIGCKDLPNEDTRKPSPELHEAAYQLFRHWTKAGQPFTPTEAIVEQQPDGNWKSSVRKLDLRSREQPRVFDETAEDELWQSVYRARESAFTTCFGPFPNDIQKLINLMGVWPGGGMFQFEATRMGGLGVCTSFGLSNVDMPTHVRVSRYERTDREGHPSFSSEIQARVPRWIPSELAGYGYEVMVLTPRPETWPLVTLGWFIQMEILNDLDLLGRVHDAQGVTVEALKIGDGSQNADFLIEPARAPLLQKVDLPNGTMHVLVATRITRDEMSFALDQGRPALLERLIQAGVGPMSILDRPSVVRCP